MLLAPRVLRGRPAMRRLLSTAELPAQAPIQMFGISGRYANALYAAASKKSELLHVERDLQLFKDTVDASPILNNFVADPSISRAQKLSHISSVMDAAKASDSTKNVMCALAENGRMPEVFKVMDQFGQIMAAAKGEMKAVVTSAQPLKAGELEEIKAQLGTLMGEGTRFDLDTRVDRALISGVTIEFGDKFLDMSCASQLKKLKSLLLDSL